MLLSLPGVGAALPQAEWIKPSSPKPGIVVLSPIWDLAEWWSGSALVSVGYHHKRDSALWNGQVWTVYQTRHWQTSLVQVEIKLVS